MSMYFLYVFFKLKSWLTHAKYNDATRFDLENHYYALTDAYKPQNVGLIHQKAALHNKSYNFAITDMYF